MNRIFNYLIICSVNHNLHIYKTFSFNISRTLLAIQDYYSCLGVRVTYMPYSNYWEDFWKNRGFCVYAWTDNSDLGDLL